MPIRAIGYLTAAFAVAENHLPNAQLQVIHPLHASERINGVSLSQTLPVAKSLDDIGVRLIHSKYPSLAERTIFATDTESVLEAELSEIEKCLGNDTKHQFERKVRGPKERYLGYIGAHVLLHDTASGIESTLPDNPELMVPGRIISLGAQSERLFYQARMECKASGLAVPLRVAETGQLFTRHVLPPYLPCNEGEPEINHSYTFGLPDSMTEHSVASVRRDLAYLQSTLKGDHDA